MSYLESWSVQFRISLDSVANIYHHLGGREFLNVCSARLPSLFKDVKVEMWLGRTQWVRAARRRAASTRGRWPLSRWMESRGRGGWREWRGQTQEDRWYRAEQNQGGQMEAQCPRKLRKRPRPNHSPQGNRWRGGLARESPPGAGERTGTSARSLIVLENVMLMFIFQVITT